VIISLVVAASKNNVIGKDNHLLWCLPNDMAFFKNVTWGMPVIMGRKTFESLGRPLKGRPNIIITRQSDYHPEGATVVSNLEEAVRAGAAEDVKEVFVVGGGEIYKQSMSTANKVYLTRVHVTLEGDTSFPELDPNVWQLTSEQSFEADANHDYSYSFQLWERIGKN
jgi:dihydrofolate reductase